MGQSIISAAVWILWTVSLWAVCTCQLAFHTDTNTNSFTLKAPGIHQTFTRYFGGQQGNLIQQQAQPSQQQQQVVPAPQNYAYQPSNDYQQGYEAGYSGFAQQQQQQAQPSQQQQQFISAQEYAAYLQQAQQQIQQTQLAASRHTGQQQVASASQQQAPVGITPGAHQAHQAQAQAAASNLLGVAFSPSNQVSHVKFSGGGLEYNF